MTADDFRSAISAAGLRQRHLAELLGVDPTTVNRWLNEGSRHIEPPVYAINFVRAWSMLTLEQKSHFAASRAISMPDLTVDQKSLVNDTLEKAAASCQSVLDGLKEWSHDYDNGFGHACDACIARIRALKVD